MVEEKEKRKVMEWNPHTDITAYELAMCIPVFSKTSAYDVGIYLNELDDSCRRHWTIRDTTEEDLIVDEITDETSSQPRIIRREE